MPDSLSAQIAESTQEIIETTQLMMPQFSPSMNLVTRIDIPKGNNSAELPAVNSVPTVLTPTEGDEITQRSQFDLTSTTINPVERAIMVRVSKRAERFSKDDVIAVVSEWLARQQAINVEQDIVSQFQNFNSANDLGGDTTDLPLSTIRTGMRLLKEVTYANGGPAPDPISGVFAPVAGEDLMTDIGVQGVVGSTNPWIPAGLSEEVIRNFGLIAASQQMMLLGGMIFISSALEADSYGAASGGRAGALFSKKALYTAISQDWDLETFSESEWLGPILRVYADFDTGVGPYDRWGCFILTDGT